MIEVIPAILPKNYENLKNEIALVRGVVPVVQVDICDGVFVKSITWPFLAAQKRPDLGNSKRSGLEEKNLDPHFERILNEQEGMPFWEDVDFELDLMVRDSVENFDIYTKLGARRIIFHIEAVGNLEDFRNFLEGIDKYVRDSIEIGLAINPATPFSELSPLIPSADFVQCMGNDKIGYHGVGLDEQVYEKIKTLRKKYPDLPIAVDIGVSTDTASLLVAAGATKLVAGSAIFNTDDIINTIEKFKNL